MLEWPVRHPALLPPPLLLPPLRQLIMAASSSAKTRDLRLITDVCHRHRLNNGLRIYFFPGWLAQWVEHGL